MSHDPSDGHSPKAATKASTETTIEGRIEAKPNGPLLVKQLTRLQNAKGEALETKPVMALCRCGQSRNKPFCDGTHRDVGFSDDNQADKSLGKNTDRQDPYGGKDVEILDNRSICAHVGLCTENLAAVFRLNREPWIDPDGAPPEAIAEAVRQCPSGALAANMRDSTGEATVEGTAEGTVEDADLPAGITVSHNGPYYARGDITLVDARWGAGANPRRYALCRCGASQNKPFCDGSHWAIKFSDAGD